MKHIFATFSQKLFIRTAHTAAIHALGKSAGNSARKAGRKTQTKAKGYCSGTLLLCLASLFLTGPVAAKAPSALGYDKVAFAASSQSRGGSKPSTKNSVKKASAQQQKVDLNSASADEIAKTLSGVGPRKAQAMVKYRNEVGPFRSMDEVLEVKGFGPSILARNKGRIQLGKAAKKR